MFIIEGMEKVQHMIEENWKQKLTKHKKLSNNTLIEIDNCSFLEIVMLQENLLEIAAGKGITFISGKGKRKHKYSCMRHPTVTMLTINGHIKLSVADQSIDLLDYLFYT